MSSRAQFKSISSLWHSAFFMIQLSHPYTTTGKTIALTVWAFFGKVMFLLLNTLSRFVIAFLPRSKCLLISWLLIEQILGENNKISPPYPQAQPLGIEKTQNFFRKFHKAKLEFSTRCLYSIYIVLGIISNLETKYVGPYV